MFQAFAEWVRWREWGSCSAECLEEGGTRSRQRGCRYYSESDLCSGLGDCPFREFSGEDCGKLTGTPILLRDSSISALFRPDPGHWSPWSQWSSCTLSCGVGRKIRSKRCVPDREGDPCPKCDGDQEEDQIKDCVLGVTGQKHAILSFMLMFNFLMPLLNNKKAAAHHTKQPKKSLRLPHSKTGLLLIRFF